MAALEETAETAPMIGVIANPAEQATVQEFFELFKTPWEFCRSERQYEVLISCGDVALPECPPRLLVLYGSQTLPLDAEYEIKISSGQKEGRILTYDGMQVPIYGSSITFRERSDGCKVEEDFHPRSMYLSRLRGSNLARIGYDLFNEIRTLLTAGQPAANAGIPTLELHIALLRNLILASGLSLVEIPPVPEGYPFIACLTHDVDHPSIRQHKLDHTILGFLYRAIFGSLISVLQGRRPARDLLTNWWAALRLPLVQLGLARDFWGEFDRYPQLERGVVSSFFVIPFKDTPGRAEMGSAPKRRASRYGATDIVDQIQSLKSAGCEIGLHGIDAWIDSSKGFEELEHVRQVSGMKVGGVRMHWLYQNELSPAKLEKAGADYDSTVGYNQTIGYRAGTTQCYKPLETTHLLELPLNIMDTALFFPAYLNLSSDEAHKHVGSIIENALRFGGSVTVNWHDRSIAPERLWGDFYIALVDELKNRGAWLSTASDAVSWFRKRRSAVFESASADSGGLRVKVGVNGNGKLPGLRLRVHRPGEPPQDTAISTIGPERIHEISLNQGVAG